MQDDIQRTLGRIEQAQEDQGEDIGELKAWHIRHDETHEKEHNNFVIWRDRHEQNDHGRHGKGPWGLISVETGIKGGGLLTILALWEAVQRMGFLPWT